MREIEESRERDCEAVDFSEGVEAEDFGCVVAVGRGCGLVGVWEERYWGCLDGVKTYETVV